MSRNLRARHPVRPVHPERQARHIRHDRTYQYRRREEFVGEVVVEPPEPAPVPQQKASPPATGPRSPAARSLLDQVREAAKTEAMLKNQIADGRRYLRSLVDQLRGLEVDDWFTARAWLEGIGGDPRDQRKVSTTKKTLQTWLRRVATPVAKK